MYNFAHRRSALIRLGGMFVLAFLIHALTPVSTQGDSRWTILAALNLIHHGTFDLRANEEAIVRSEFYAVECVFPDQHRLYPLRSLAECGPPARLYALYPATISVLAVPVVAPLEWFLWTASPVLLPVRDRVRLPMLRAFLAGDLEHATPLVEKVVASLFTALAAVVIYHSALALLTPSLALAHAGLFVFGTLAFSLASRALWHHGPSMLLNALAIWLLMRQKLERRHGIALGAVLAAAFFIRPTNAVPAVAIGLLFVFRFRLPIWWLVAGVTPVSVACFGLNVMMYGQAISSYFRVNVPGVSTGAIHGLFLHGAYGEAVLSNLVSPARGMFVYMPFLLLLLIPGVWARPVPELYSRLRGWFVAILALHWLLVSGYSDWWSGYSYGPRYLSDLLPYWMYLWLPVWGWASGVAVRKGALAVVIGAALFINFRGATDIAVHHWNSTPVPIGQDLRRIWNWRDVPFFR